MATLVNWLLPNAGYKSLSSAPYRQYWPLSVLDALGTLYAILLFVLAVVQLANQHTFTIQSWLGLIVAGLWLAATSLGINWAYLRNGLDIKLSHVLRLLWSWLALLAAGVLIAYVYLYTSTTYRGFIDGLSFKDQKPYSDVVKIYMGTLWLVVGYFAVQVVLYLGILYRFVFRSR